MKRFWLLFVGILFLAIDVIVATGVKYPEYQIQYDDSYANGKKTQAMVMYDVVGTEMKLDVVPDLIGFGLLLVILLGFGGAEKGKANPKAFAALVGAVAAEVLIPIAPFLLAEVNLYGAEYFLGWLAPIFKYTFLFFVVKQVMDELECKQNHRDNILIWTGLLASIFCGFIGDMTQFFQLTKTSMVYQILEVVFTLLYSFKLFRCYQMMGMKANWEKDALWESMKS